MTTEPPPTTPASTNDPVEQVRAAQERVRAAQPRVPPPARAGRRKPLAILGRLLLALLLLALGGVGGYFWHQEGLWPAKSTLETEALEDAAQVWCTNNQARVFLAATALDLLPEDSIPEAFFYSTAPDPEEEGLESRKATEVLRGLGEEASFLPSELAEIVFRANPDEELSITLSNAVGTAGDGFRGWALDFPGITEESEWSAIWAVPDLNRACRAAYESR